ncbi:MAG: hypothetical protein P8X47_06600 [Ignavibacteriaceae bacterium]
MKKMFVLFLLIVPCIFTQEINNGNISLVFNDEKIDMPINNILLNKDDSIVLSFKAEKQDSTVQQFVTLTLGLKKLSSEPEAESLEGTKIIIRTRDKKTDSGKELSVWFNEDESKHRKKHSETIHYGIYSKGERVSWEITSVSLKIDITEVQLKDGVMHIKGEFNGEFKSNAAPPGQIAKIENGEFTIIF